MKNRIVRFAVYDNNNFHKIELSRTLLHFTEFDFTYFWEQCIEAGKIARKTGRLPSNVVSNAKIAISKAHPYIEASISTEFSEVVIDCIIEYICHSELISLEKLWTRCISPKNPYETAIFRRISEYKTNRAANRWTSIMRLQEYARNKTEFIFSTDDNESVASDELINIRKEYFDLTFSVAANELGCPSNALPSVKLCTPATLPNATFAMSKVSKSIYRRYSDELSQGQDMSHLESVNCSKIRDYVAMEAFSYVKNMPLPTESDMVAAIDVMRDNPQELYLVDSLKSAIDLEFEFMIRNKVYLRKCVECGKFFTFTDSNPRCDRVNSSGKTCRKQFDDLIAAENAPDEKNEITIPAEMEKRSQKLYNALYKRIGKGIEENEFKEWSQYLSNMKRNLKIGEASLSQLEEFLDYSDKLCDEVKIAGKNKTTHAPVEKTYEHSTPKTAEEHVPMSQQLPQTSVISSDNVNIKPFVPQTFDTVFDAIAATPDFGDEQDNQNPFLMQFEEVESKKKKYVEIKMPQWERLTREDAYGKKK